MSGVGYWLRLSKSTLTQLGTSQTPTNVPWIVRDVSRPLQEPYPECPQCGRHEYKTYHFQLNHEGHVEVSETIWNRLQELYDYGGFELVDYNEEPEAQTLVVPTGSIKMTIQNL